MAKEESSLSAEVLGEETAGMRYEKRKQMTRLTLYALERRFSPEIATDWAWNNTPLPIGLPSAKQIWRAWLVITGLWSWAKLIRIDDEEVMMALKACSAAEATHAD